MKLAEMVNSANYASMSYQELVTINFAFLLAIGEVKPLMRIKKAEEMAAHTQEYVAKMKRYFATKEEILACIEKEMMEVPPHTPFPHQEVDDQTSDSISGDVRNNRHDNREVLLLLPEPKDVAADAHRDDHAETTSQEDETDQDDSAVSSSDEETYPVNAERKEEEKDQTESEDVIVPETNEQTLVKKAIEMSRTLPEIENINVNAPYYAERVFKSDLAYRDAYGRNLRAKDLEAFRSASEKYMTLFLKKDVLVSTEECLVSKEDDGTIRVRMYCFPEEKCDEYETQKQAVDSDNSSVSEETMKELKMKKSLMRKAIKLAKEYSYSDGTDVHTPFYDKYVFTLGWKNKLEIKGERVRVYEDAATITELKPAFETYAGLFNERYMALSKDNCVAAMDLVNIYLVLFNIPTQEKKKRVTKKTKSVTKDIPAAEESVPVSNASSDQAVSNVIIKAVEMTRALPVSKGIDVNTPYYVQQEYVISNDGGLFPDGKTFSTNFSIDTLDKKQASNRKLARAMNASALVSGNDYTAFIWNDGKNVRVYSYHI